MPKDTATQMGPVVFLAWLEWDYWLLLITDNASTVSPLLLGFCLTAEG